MDHYTRHSEHNNDIIDTRDGRCVASTTKGRLFDDGTSGFFSEWMVNCYIHPDLCDRILQLTNGYWYNLDDSFRRLATDENFTFQQGGNTLKVKEWLRKSIIMLLEGWHFTYDYCYIDKISHNTYYFNRELTSLLHPHHIFADMDEGDRIFMHVRDWEESRRRRMYNGDGTVNNPIDLVSLATFTVDMTDMSGSLFSTTSVDALIQEFQLSVEVFQDDTISLLSME